MTQQNGQQGARWRVREMNAGHPKWFGLRSMSVSRGHPVHHDEEQR